MDTLRVNNVLKRKVITASRLAGGTQVVVGLFFAILLIVCFLSHTNFGDTFMQIESLAAAVANVTMDGNGTFHETEHYYGNNITTTLLVLALVSSLITFFLGILLCVNASIPSKCLAHLWLVFQTVNIALHVVSVIIAWTSQPESDIFIAIQVILAVLEIIFFLGVWATSSVLMEDPLHQPGTELENLSCKDNHISTSRE